MPSAMPQLNVRVPETTLARLAELRAALESERGHPVSQPEAVATAISEATERRRKRAKNNSGKIQKSH
jgi:hypothetical protein